jgi:peptide maturation system protein (TIGR04066 family)
MYKNKAIIYPFDSQSTYFFSFNDLNKQFNVVGAVSPNGWGLTNKDVGLINGEDFIGYDVKNSFDEFNNEYFDTVILVDSYRKIDFINILFKNLEILTQRGKSIICYRKLTKEEHERIIDLCIENNVNYLYQEKITDNNAFLNYQEKGILKIGVPVIFVLGNAERTQKFQIQLVLRQGLEKMGYKVGQVGSKDHCETFGFHSFPKFMYESGIKEENKIIMFNRFIKTIEEKENPDLIIIGIPGGVMPINKEFTERFGILAYLTSQAVKPDATVLSLLFEDYNEEYYNEIEKLTRYRLGCLVDCYNLSNIKFDYMQSKMLGEKCYSVIDSSYINKKISECEGYGKPIFNIMDMESKDKMVMNIINVLANENQYYGI